MPFSESISPMWTWRLAITGVHHGVIGVHRDHRLSAERLRETSAPM
jgi:hypothetical protein